MSSRKSHRRRHDDSDDEIKTDRPTMDAALKGFLVQRMKELESEGRSKHDDEPERKSKHLKSSVVVGNTNNNKDDIDTPSSLSSDDDSKRKKKKTSKERKSKKDSDLEDISSDDDEDKRHKHKKKKHKEKHKHKRKESSSYDIEKEARDYTMQITIKNNVESRDCESRRDDVKSRDHIDYRDNKSEDGKDYRNDKDRRRSGSGGDRNRDRDNGRSQDKERSRDRGRSRDDDRNRDRDRGRSDDRYRDDSRNRDRSRDEERSRDKESRYDDSSKRRSSSARSPSHRVDDKSRSRDRHDIKQSRDRRSRSRERSRDHRSRSRDHRSRSRDHRSRSRDHRSRSRDDRNEERSRSRNHRSLSRDHSRKKVKSHSRDRSPRSAKPSSKKRQSSKEKPSKKSKDKSGKKSKHDSKKKSKRESKKSTKKVKDKKKKKKDKKKEKEDDSNVEYDEFGEKIDYNFEEDPIESFTPPKLVEEGEVSSDDDDESEDSDAENESENDNESDNENESRGEETLDEEWKETDQEKESENEKYSEIDNETESEKETYEALEKENDDEKDSGEIEYEEIVEEIVEEVVEEEIGSPEQKTLVSPDNMDYKNEKNIEDAGGKSPEICSDEGKNSQQSEQNDSIGQHVNTSVAVDRKTDLPKIPAKLGKIQIKLGASKNMDLVSGAEKDLDKTENKESESVDMVNKCKWDSDYEGDDSPKPDDPPPDVEAIVAVAKACHNIKLMGVKKTLKAEDVFDTTKVDKKKTIKLSEPKKLGLGLKLSDGSAKLISSGLSFDNKRKVLLEEGEVAESDSKSDISSASLDVSDLSSTGSIHDDDDGTKKKKKKVKKEKKKKKKKDSKKRKSVSRSRSRSPKRSRDSGESRRHRLSPSSGSRRRSRSPVSDWPSGRWRSPSPRSRSRRYRSRSPRSRDSRGDPRDRRARSRSPRDRDRSRRDRSRSPAYYQWQKRAEITKAYRDRTLNRAPIRDRLGRRDRSPSLHIDKEKLREIAIKNTLANQKAGNNPVKLNAEELARIRSGGSSDVQQLTEFCKKMARKEGDPVDDDEDEPTQKPIDSEDESEEEEGELRKDGTIVMNIRNAKPVPVLTPAQRAAQAAVLSKQFPVSSGNVHRSHESEWTPVEPKPPPPPKPKPKPKPEPPKPAVPAPNQSTLSGIAFQATEHQNASQTLASTAVEIAREAEAEMHKTDDSALMPPPAAPGGGASAPPIPALERIFPVSTMSPTNITDLVSKRLAAMKKLAQNPHDVEAMGIMYDANQKMKVWAESRKIPGQFLGSTEAKILTKEELIGNKRGQAWAKPGQAAAAAPVAGLGKFLLEKMGWKQGEGLGKSNEGPLQPLMLDQKMDRKGLQSTAEILGSAKGQNNLPKRGPPVKDLSGKHPVSALGELCVKRRWGLPNYIEVRDTGPPHHKLFLFKVVVDNVEYQPAVGSRTKKVAKAEAAAVCLQELGLLPR